LNKNPKQPFLCIVSTGITPVGQDQASAGPSDYF